MRLWFRYLGLPVQLLIVAAAITVVVVGVAVASLAVVNRTVVGPAAEQAVRAIAASCPCEVRVGGARFRLFRGLQIVGAELSLPQPALSARAERVDVRIGIVGLLRMRRAIRESVDASDPRDLAAWAADRRIIPSRVVARGASVELSEPGLPVVRAGWDRIEARHRARDERITFHAPVSGLPAMGADATLDYGGRTAEVSAVVRGFPLAEFGAADGVFDVELHARAGSSTDVDLEGVVSVRDTTLVLPTVASRPITPLAADYRFSARLHPDYPVSPTFHSSQAFPYPIPSRRRVDVSDGRLTVNGVSLDVRPSLRGSRYLDLSVDLPPTRVQEIRSAMPVALLGDLETMEMDGRFRWELDLRVDLQAIGEMVWTATTELTDFAVTRIGETVNPYKLNESFVHVIEDESVGYRRVVRIPPTVLPGIAWVLEHSEHSHARIVAWRADEARQAEAVAASPPIVTPRRTETRAGDRDPITDSNEPDPFYTYTRLERMSPWVVRAILTAEDGDFFFHEGVNFYTLPRALERNIGAREIQFGASTISMQVVKMLFLDQQRIVSRKLQEVWLVFLMEQQVPVAKSRILEIYVNTAEFGPGVFGIADAARYYFGTTPAGLTAGEATWLASILPSPRRYHQYYEAGFISDGWFERMKSYFDIMLERGRMTPEEHEEASREPPRFRRN